MDIDEDYENVVDVDDANVESCRVLLDVDRDAEDVADAEDEVSDSNTVFT